MFFSRFHHTQIAADRPELSILELAKEMTAHFERMADDEKQKYVDMAQQDRERYESEKAEYEKDYGNH